MNLSFSKDVVNKYHSKSQIARVLTENWVKQNMFCPICGFYKINHLKNNLPVADFCCPHCGAQYELKSKRGKLGEKVVDGAYQTMVERITSFDNPNFFFMSYSMNNFCVTDFILIPKHFFIPEIIERRNPLSATAKRAGWIGCNILLNKIPEQGRISVIHGGCVELKELVVEKMKRAQRLSVDNITARGWLSDILNCVNSIPYDQFELSDIYRFETFLNEKHQNNHNIRAKIRQQLQILRDKGFIKFVGKGKYMKV